MRRNVAKNREHALNSIGHGQSEVKLRIMSQINLFVL